MFTDTVVAYASRALSDSESRLMSQLEREATACLYGATKFKDYILGGPTVDIVTDHKPLLSISRKCLADAPVRLQRIFMQLSRYNYRPVFCSGQNIIWLTTCQEIIYQLKRQKPA